MTESAVQPATAGSDSGVPVKKDGHNTILESFGFQVDKTLGYGSYATVKLAYSQRHRCKVAIKVISKRKAPTDYLHKFLPREIEVVKILRHPSLTAFLQSIETTNRVYLVMELANRGDLLGVISEHGFIQEKQAGIWFSQMTEGIGYCHRKGVVHRDLKCENVLLDSSYNLKVTDFGFARGDMAPENGGAKLSDTFCGSYAYAPPEILTGTPYDPHLADVWSMGVILYTMVFGRLPYNDSDHKLLLKQVHNPVVFPDKPASVSEQCKTLITKILVPSKKRIYIKGIKENEWYVTVAPTCNDTNKNQEKSGKLSAMDTSN